jgi:hypothetical protein
VSPTFIGARSSPGGGEFLQGDPTLGLQTDVDDREVLFDRHDDALHHLAFHDVTPAEGLVEQRGEIVARGVEAHIVSHVIFRSK